MRRLTLTLVLLASMSASAPAHAAPAPPSAHDVMKQAMASIIVPVEWDGIWSTLDTMYTCAGVFQTTSSSLDTLCGGRDYSADMPEAEIVFDCTGTATATTMDITCTGSVAILECTAHYTIVTQGTRTGDSYRTVTTSEVTYSGTAPECAFLPPSCTQFNSWGTRIGPAPPSYCSTPAHPSSWGRLKTIYR